MDNPLIPPALVLAVTNVIFFCVSLYWRRQAKRHAAENIRLSLQLARTRIASYSEGWSDGERLAIGRMYKAAIIADRAELDMLDALRSAGRHAIEDEPAPSPSEAGR